MYYTASGIVTICRWPSGAQVGRGLQTYYKTRICALSWSVAKIILRCSVSITPKLYCSVIFVGFRSKHATDGQPL